MDELSDAVVNESSGGDVVASTERAETMSQLDLSPRINAAATPKAKKRWPTFAGLFIAVALIGVVMIGLNEATVYFKYVDEAVSQRSELGGDFFRMQGNVVKGSVKQMDDGAQFTLARHGVTATVVHSGAEPALFGDPRIPVVVEGHWQGDQFLSQRIIVNHDATYKEANADRIAQADAEAETEATATSSMP